MVLGTPLARCELTVNRRAAMLTPGDVFKLRQPDLGIELVMRVTKTAIGMPTAARIRYTAVQDVFSLAQNALVVSGGTNWIDPNPGPAAVAVQRAIELPYALNSDESGAGYLTLAIPPSGGSLAYEIWDKTTGDYALSSTGNCWTPAGLLVGPYTGTVAKDGTGFIVSPAPGSNLGQLSSATEAAIRAAADGPVNLGMFENGEWFTYESVASGQAGIIISGISAGLFDTPISAHAAGERVWFVSSGYGLCGKVLPQSVDRTVALLPTSTSGKVEITAATPIALDMADRNKRPLPPAAVLVNGQHRPATTQGDVSLSWKHRNRRTQPKICFQQDPSFTPEGTYTVQLLIGGVVKRTWTGLTSDCLFTSGAMALASVDAMVVKGGSIHLLGAGGVGAVVYRADSGGLVQLHGSPAQKWAYVDGTGGVSRLKSPDPALAVNTSGDMFLIDAESATPVTRTNIRRIVASSGLIETWLSPTIAPWDGMWFRGLTSDGTHLYTIQDLYQYGRLAYRYLAKIDGATKAITQIVGGAYWSGPVTGLDRTSWEAFTGSRLGWLIAGDNPDGGYIWTLGADYNEAPVLRRWEVATGVLTEIALTGLGDLSSAAWIYAAGRAVRRGSIVYVPLQTEIRAITTAGATSTFASGRYVTLGVDPSGHLVATRVDGNSLSSGKAEIGRLSSGGAFTSVVVHENAADRYTLAMRQADDPDASKPVEFRVAQGVGQLSSAWASSGTFVMG